MSYCATVLSPGPQESVHNGFCLSSFFLNSQNNNEPAVSWSTCQIVIPSCCEGLTGICGHGTGGKSWRGSSGCRAPLTTRGKLCQSQRMGDAPKATREPFCCSTRHRKCPEGNMLFLWVCTGCFSLSCWARMALHAQPLMEEVIKVIAAGGAARTTQAFPWEKNSTKPLV